MKKAIADIPALTGLRGVAALWVCIFHYTYSNQYGAFLTPIAHAGSQGVVTFFVLSGFIMMHVYGASFEDRTVSFAKFLWHRLARVYPLYLLALCAVALLMLYGVMPYGPRDNPATFAMNLLMVQAWGLINPITWNEPAWSISTEFACYLAFPFMAAFLYRRSMWWSIAAIAGLFYVWQRNYVIRAIATAVQLTGRPYEGVIFAYGGSLSAFLMTFIAGAILYQVARRPRSTEIADTLMMAGAALLMGSVIDGSVNQISSAGASMLIVLGLSRNAGAGRIIFGNRAAVWLGNVSYALYLSHVALTNVWVYCLKLYAPGFWFHEVPLSVRLCVALVVAAILHYGFELPARRFLRSLTAPKAISGHVAR
jgi:peptidoglycan/LPS O-acetylase OafA/YrhL